MMSSTSRARVVISSRLLATRSLICAPCSEREVASEIFCAVSRAAWDSLARGEGLEALCERKAPQADSELARRRAEIDRFFALPTVREIVLALEADGSPWAADTAAVLRKRSPLMLHVTLEHVRRARHMTLAADLRMERDMVRHCFHLRPGAASETVEGIRALAVDKDHAPRWNPPRIEDVEPAMVQAFFDSPWPAHAHPLRDLA